MLLLEFDKASLDWGLKIFLNKRFYLSFDFLRIDMRLNWIWMMDFEWVNRINDDY